MAFTRATKQQAKLRMAIHGPSGSGKTRSALEIAKYLVPGGRIALIDTERGSASKYADKVEFDVCEIDKDYHPDRLLDAMRDANGYDVVIVDSLSHFWNGPGGLLELVDTEAKRQAARGEGNRRPDAFGAWKVVDGIYRRMVQGILAAPMHLILTMRAKQEYVKEEDDRGKTKIRKVGMAPEMRDAFQYEADIEGMLDISHNLVIGKTRCDALDEKVFHKPGRELADILRAWLTDGDPETPKEQVEPQLEQQLSESVRVGGRELADNAASLEVQLEQATTRDALVSLYATIGKTKLAPMVRKRLTTMCTEKGKRLRAAAEEAARPAPATDDELPEWAGGKAPVEDEERAAIQGA